MFILAVSLVVLSIFGILCTLSYFECYRRSQLIKIIMEPFDDCQKAPLLS